MSVLKTLRERVAPELNHLYTDPPADRPTGGVDFGWHPREHALHAYFVARMFGAEAELCSGDFGVISRFLPPLTSVDTDVDHSWCSVGGVAPVDLALTFRHFADSPQLRTPITGEGRNGDWNVIYAADDSPLDESVGEGNEILFIERRGHPDSPAALLENPCLFLGVPRAGTPEGGKALPEPGLHAKISLHCYLCATTGAKSVRHRFARQEALAWITANYPGAEARILELLG